jgi:hypothetical protein
MMFNLSATVAAYEDLCSAALIKRAETEVVEEAADNDWVRSKYLAFLSARDQAGRLLRERLDELARRVEMVGEQE